MDRVIVHLHNAIYMIPIGADPYCVVRCGRSKAFTPVKKNTLSPSFNAKVQFFVSNPGSAEVTVEVSMLRNIMIHCMS